MNRPDQIKALAKRLKAEDYSNELNKALTHSSYTESNENDNNSRFVYLGQFAFRGYVADLIYKFTPGTGTQLQHILGNLFKSEHLNTLFDRFGLEELIRYSGKFDPKAHRHIFVFGLLGFIHKYCPDDVKQILISRYFILPHKHLFSAANKSNGLQAQCNILSRILFQEPVFIDINRTENGLWQTTVSVKESVISCETSVSHRYSRQKTLKKALKTIVR